MTIDKRINFRGGGAYQGGSGAPGSAESSSRSTSSGTGGGSGNPGGGGGGQDTDYRRYSPPVAPTYNSSNIDQKPVTGDDYRRSQNEFINNFNQNEASRFEPTFFNRNYDPITLDQFGSSNQPRNYGNAAMGGILSLITGNPLASLAYRGYNSLKDKIPEFNLNSDQGLTGIESVQTVGSDFPLNIQEIQGLINNSQTEGATGLTFQEIQSLIDNSRNNLG